jgi:uncharacterized protein YjbJ (UPF0337 family)
MNKERFGGICLQLSGYMTRTWGELTDDPQLVAEGTRSQATGRARQRRGIAEEKSARQMREFLRRNRNWYF